MARAYVRRAVKARARPIFRRVYRRPPARKFAHTKAAAPTGTARSWGMIIAYAMLLAPLLAGILGSGRAL